MTRSIRRTAHLRWPESDGENCSSVLSILHLGKKLPTLYLHSHSSGRRDGQEPRDLVSGCWSMYSLSQNIAHKFRLAGRVVCNRYIRSSGRVRYLPDDD